MIQPYMTTDKTTEPIYKIKVRKSELINDKCVDMYS